MDGRADFLDDAEKKKIVGLINNVSFYFYTGFDIRILFAAIIILIFLIIAPFAVIALNGNYNSNFQDTDAVIFVAVYSALVFVLLCVIFVQIIRIFVINKGYFLRQGDGRETLITNGFFCKSYKIGRKKYIVRRGEAIAVRKLKSDEFGKLLSVFKTTEIYKRERGGKTVYSTKLLKTEPNWCDWFIETGLSSLPAKYASLKFKGYRIISGILNGSQRQCATYFKFGKIKKSADKFKLPEGIIIVSN